MHNPTDGLLHSLGIRPQEMCTCVWETRISIFMSSTAHNSQNLETIQIYYKVKQINKSNKR